MNHSLITFISIFLSSVALAEHLPSRYADDYDTDKYSQRLSYDQGVLDLRQSELNQAQNRLNRAKDEFSEKQRNLGLAHKRIRDDEELIRDLRVQNANLERDAKVLDDAEPGLRQQIQVQNAQMGIKAGELQNAESDLSSQSAQLKSAKDDQKRKEDIARPLMVTAGEKQTKVNGLQTQYDNLDSQLQPQLKRLAEATQNLNNENNQEGPLKQKLASAQADQVAAKTRADQALQKWTDQKNKEAQICKGNPRSVECRAATAEVIKAKQEFDAANADLQTKSRNVAVAEKQYSDHTARAGQYAKEKSDAKANVDQLQVKIGPVSQQLSQAKQELSQAKAAMKPAVDEMNAAKAKTAQVQQAHDAAVTRKASIENEMIAIQNRVESLTKQINQNKATASNMRNKIQVNFGTIRNREEDKVATERSLPGLQREFDRAQREVEHRNQDANAAGYAYNNALSQYEQDRRRLEEVTNNLNIGLRVAANNASYNANVGGQREGYNQGQTDGQRNGSSDGYMNGRKSGESLAGSADGQQLGSSEGSQYGRNSGTVDGSSKGKEQGLAEGYSKGFNDEYEGKPQGLREGKAAAEKSDADQKGYSDGYSGGLARAKAQAADVGGKAGSAQADKEFYNASLNNVVLQNPAPVTPLSGIFGQPDWERSPSYNPTPDQNYPHPRLEDQYRISYRDAFIRAAGDEYGRSYPTAYNTSYNASYSQTESDFRNRRFPPENQKSQSYRDAYNSAYFNSYKKL